MSWRVLHVVDSLQPAAGSIAIGVAGLNRALPSAGVESDALDDAGRLDEAVRRANLVHIHGWEGTVTQGAARLARKNRKPYIVSPLGSLTPGPHHRRSLGHRIRSYIGERGLIRGAAVVTALNGEDERGLRAANVHGDIRQLPYGIHFDEYQIDAGQRVGAESSGLPRTLLMLGPIDPVCGCVALLKAFAELGPDADGWNVELAGRDAGNRRRMLEAAVHRKGGEGRVTFTDSESPAAQRASLARVSLLAAPSLHVRPAMSIMQALAAGVPVIASTLCAPPGLGGCIQVCGPSRAELREVLRAMLTTSEQQRRAAASAALVAARAEWDWSVLAPRYLRMYRDIA